MSYSHSILALIGIKNLVLEWHSNVFDEVHLTAIPCCSCWAQQVGGRTISSTYNHQKTEGINFIIQTPILQSHLCARMVCFRFMDQMDCMLQVLFPLAPGIESIYEPAMEEVEEALEGAQEKMEHMQSELRQEAEQVQRKVKGWVKGGRK